MQSKAIRQEDRGWRAPAQGDQSDALSRTRSHPDALSHTQTRSDALRCTQTHSDALTSSMRLSSVIRLNQTHSDALRRAHLLNAIEHPLNLHNLVSLHWRVSRVLTAEQQAVHVARYLMREVIRGHQRADQSQSEPIRANQRGSLPVASDLPHAPSAAREG
jgi:hypothetical protein